jgi:hypothetical protein
MTKWEYAIAKWYTSIKSFSFSAESGSQRWKVEEDNEMVEILNDLGNEGWEMIAQSQGTSDSYTWVFKRQVK